MQHSIRIFLCALASLFLTAFAFPASASIVFKGQGTCSYSAFTYANEFVGYVIEPAPCLGSYTAIIEVPDDYVFGMEQMYHGFAPVRFSYNDQFIDFGTAYLDGLKIDLNKAGNGVVEVNADPGNFIARGPNGNWMTNWEYCLGCAPGGGVKGYQARGSGWNWFLVRQVPEPAGTLLIAIAAIGLVATRLLRSAIHR